MALTDTQVYFDGNDLSVVAGASLINHDFNALPNRDIKTYKLARVNKSITTSAEYSDKRVSVDFHLKGCDRGAAEAVLADLKSILRSVSKDLIVSQGNIDTTYSGATLNAIEMRWLFNIIIITLSFEVSDPIGFQDSDTTLLSANVTSSTSTSAITVSGSFDALPVITLSYTSISGGTGQELSIKNEETGQGITLSQDFATSDTVEINSKTKKVIMNGSEIDYSGVFPVFPPGSGAFGYVDTFTTRDVDITITYNKRYA